MPCSADGARTYFDRIPAEWDALYSHENRFMYLFNRLFRSGLYRRHELTFSKCGEIEGANVLDIGCGTGRYSVEFAKRGAAKVVGLDFAPAMIEFSQQMAGQMGVADLCEFICGDIRTARLENPFDIIVAIGLFDYVSDPGPLFQQIAALTRRTFLASFPKYSLIWGLQRKIRYEWIKKCPIYYYTKDQLTRLAVAAGFSNLEIIAVEHGYFLVGEKT